MRGARSSAFDCEVLHVVGAPEVGSGPPAALRTHLPLLDSSLLVIARRPCAEGDR